MIQREKDSEGMNFKLEPCQMWWKLLPIHFQFGQRDLHFLQNGPHQKFLNSDLEDGQHLQVEKTKVVWA